MAEKWIFTDSEAAFLRELRKNGVPFMIVGLSAAALQGAPVVTQDVGLWFEDLSHPGIRRALHKVGGTLIPPTASTPPLFAGRGVSLFDIVLTMDGLKDFQSEMKNTIDLPLGSVHVAVLSLERIIASKEAARREKDRRVLPALKDALTVIRAEGRHRRRR